MRTVGVLLTTAFWLGVLGLAAWALGLDELLRASIAAGHLLDWVVGALGLVWLVVLLKAPWDLYFEALRASYDLQQAREAGIEVSAERDAYLARLRPRLIWLAVGAHLASGAVAAAVGYAAGGRLGYYLAAIYLLSATFRPLAAGYAFLRHRLRSMGHDARYPRLDVTELRGRLERSEHELCHLRESLDAEQSERRVETEELRGQVHRTARELETAVSRVTDNQDVIKGIQAFVRLVGSAGE